MKKFTALMVAMLMVLGFASFAAAEFELSGDARVRGTFQSNPDYDSDTDVDDRWYDSRIRLRVSAANDDGAGVKIQITAREDAWDGADATSANVPLDATGNPTVDSNGNAVVNQRENVLRFDADDYAYMFLPVADNWTLSAGFMPANWGLKFWSWGSAYARLKVSGKMDDMTVGAFTQKVTETRNADELNDYDVHAAYVIAPMGDIKVGAIAIMQQNSTTAVDATGNKLDVFFTGAVGDIAVMGEFATNMGDLNEKFEDGDSTKGANPMGVFVAGGMGMDNMKFSGAVAMTSNGYTATKYFTPTVLIGKAQPTALFNLGECGMSGTTCDTVALVLNADMAVSDEMGVGATFAYATIAGYSDTLIDGTWMEIDAKLKYALAENIAYTAKFGYGMPTVDYGPVDMELDPAYSLGHEISYKF